MLHLVTSTHVVHNIPRCLTHSMFSRNVDIEYRCPLGSEGDWFQGPHRYQDRWRVKYFMYLLVICAQLSLAWCHIWIKYLALNDVNAMEKGLHIQGRWCVLNMFGLSLTLLTWNLCRKGCRRPTEDISTLTNNQHWREVAGAKQPAGILSKEKKELSRQSGVESSTTKNGSVGWKGKGPSSWSPCSQGFAGQLSHSPSQRHL